jgi:hypothetical protein
MDQVAVHCTMLHLASLEHITRVNVASEVQVVPTGRIW